MKVSLLQCSEFYVTDFPSQPPTSSFKEPREAAPRVFSTARTIPLRIDSSLANTPLQGNSQRASVYSTTFAPPVYTIRGGGSHSSRNAPPKTRTIKEPRQLTLRVVTGKPF